MATAERGDRKGDDEGQAQDARLAQIGERVIRTLGRPGLLYTVQVRRLWGDHFRVNVLVGTDVASCRCLHSYFLAADGDGNILSASPVITRQY